jgi:uncharacterized peroxidase-related enzyme
MFISDAPLTDELRTSFERAKAETGYLANHTRLWGWRPDMDEAFLDLRMRVISTTSLSERECAVVVSAAVSTVRDSYCSLAWGSMLAGLIGDADAAGVIRDRDPDALTARERALARWVRKAVRDPNSTTRSDVDALRSAGLDDREIFEATLLAAYRLAFSTVNAALGAAPDVELVEAAPADLRKAVDFGRTALAR